MATRQSRIRRLLAHCSVMIVRSPASVSAIHAVAVAGLAPASRAARTGLASGRSACRSSARQRDFLHAPWRLRPDSHAGAVLENDLVDEMNLLACPVVVGQGTRLFPDAGPDMALDLVESRAFPKGITLQVYRPAGRPQYATA